MAWKDYFYFTRGQKIGVVLLLILIVLLSFLFWIMPYLFQSEKPLLDKGFEKKVKDFKSSLVELKRKSQYKKYPKKEYKNNYYHSNYQSKKQRLFYFDPNKIDSLTFLELGLKSYVVKNILKYRRSGGVFRKSNDFSRIYGMNKNVFKQLKPYIKIEKSRVEVAYENTELKTNDTINVVQKQEIETVEIEPLKLNLVTKEELVKIKGIGKYTANSIVYYRKKLGGFVAIEQLKEVKGMTEENYQKIKNKFTIDPTKITKINVNKATVGRLKRHPYVQFFTKAKAIYDYRREKIKLKSIEDLKVLDELTPKDIKRLKPYLSFE